MSSSSPSVSARSPPREQPPCGTGAFRAREKPARARAVSERERPGGFPGQGRTEINVQVKRAALAASSDCEHIP